MIILSKNVSVVLTFSKVIFESISSTGHQYPVTVPIKGVHFRYLISRTCMMHRHLWTVCIRVGVTIIVRDHGSWRSVPIIKLKLIPPKTKIIATKTGLYANYIFTLLLECLCLRYVKLTIQFDRTPELLSSHWRLPWNSIVP